jgi:hypothetical protein
MWWNLVLADCFQMTFASLTQQPMFRTNALAPKMASRAFPLVQLSNPFINLQAWMDYVRAHAKVARGTGGLTAIEDERGYIHGLFSWRLFHDLTCRKSLRISDLIMAHLPGRALQEAVLAEIQNLGDTTGAGAIVVEAGNNLAGLRRDALLASGFRPVGERFDMVRRAAS